MKITEAIDRMQRILKQEGDLDVVSLQEIDGLFAIDYHNTIDVIEYPAEDDETNMVKVCVLTCPQILEATGKPDLKVVK